MLPWIILLDFQKEYDGMIWPVQETVLWKVAFNSIKTITEKPVKTERQKYFWNVQTEARWSLMQ